MGLKKQTADEMCPICDKPLSAAPCSPEHSSMYTMYMRKRRYERYKAKAEAYRKQLEE